MKSIIAITVFFLAVVLTVASCRKVPTNPNSGNDTTVGPNALPSAISGLVLEGPISPVARPNETNEAPLAGAPITITNAANSTVVAKLTSDTAGKFFVRVNAGSYILTAGEMTNSGFPRPPQAQQIQVPNNTIVNDTLHYDTGIR